MTTPQEPLKLTPEALADALRQLQRTGEHPIETRERLLCEAVTHATEAVRLRDEASALKAENERLRGALRGIAEARIWCGTERDTAIYWRFADMADVALRRLAGGEDQK